MWGSDGRYDVGSPLVQVSQGGDAANLILGLPVLLGAMWLARRGSLFGLLLWPGALFYALYAYALYLVGAPFDALFFGYVALVTLSAWTLIYIVASIDGEEVRRRLAAAPARSVGGALVVIAVLAYAGLTGAVISALGSATTKPGMRPAVGRRLCARHAGTPAGWRAPVAPCSPGLRGGHRIAPGLRAERTCVRCLCRGRRPARRRARSSRPSS